MMFHGLGQTPADFTAAYSGQATPADQIAANPNAPADTNLALQCAVNPFSFLSPSCWGWTYQQMNYGTLPNAPAAATAATATPPTNSMVTSSTPDQVANYLATSQNQNATQAAQDAVNAAVLSGSYNPAGAIKAPGNMLPSEYLGYLVVAGVIVVGIVAVKVIVK